MSDVKLCVDLGTGDLFDGLGDLCGELKLRDTEPLLDAIVASAGPEAFAGLRGREPLVLRGLAAEWPALARWTEPARIEAMASDEVLVLRSRDGRRFLKCDCKQERWPLDDVLTHLFPTAAGGDAAQIYARAPLSAHALADCDMGAIEAMMEVPAKLCNASVWLGSHANVTPFHYDHCHGFLVQVVGEKTFTFVEPSQWRCMYPREPTPELSRVDFEAWRSADPHTAELERRRHPKFDRAALRSVTVRPGDVLYTPPYWWHHVETSGDGSGISVLVPFDQTVAESALSEHSLCHHMS